MLYIHNSDFTPKQQKTLGELYKLYGRYTGLINGCLERDTLKDFDLYWFQTLSTRSSRLFSQDKDLTSGGLGIDSSREIALLKSFGEALERHSLSYYNPSCFLWHTAQDVERLQPDVQLQYLSENVHQKLQINKHYARRNESIAWVHINALGGSRSILYPAGQIYLPCKETKRLTHTTSSGTAFHADTDVATLSGLMEVVERDAIILNHYLVALFEHIDIRSLPSEIISKVVQQGLEITFIRLYSDTDIPVVLCLLNPQQPTHATFGIGCSAGLSEVEACDKALREALFTYSYAPNLLHLRVDRIDALTTLYEHFLFYQTPLSYGRLRARYSNNYTREASEDTIEPSDILARCASVFMEDIYKIDITPHYIAQLGYSTLKVIIPRAYDLHTREAYLNIKTKRVDQFKQFCREQSIPLLKNISDIPHPMP